VYFKHLNTPAAYNARLMQSIPNSAAVVFEFDNDDGFYEIFNGNNLLSGLTGKEKLTELTTLRDNLLLNPALKNFFIRQPIYISVLGLPRDSIGFLITLAGNENFAISHLDQLANGNKQHMLIKHIKLADKNAYNIYLNDIKKQFYLVNIGNNLFAGSFSKDVATLAAQYQPGKNEQNFIPVPDQQSTNSLVNLYINYKQLDTLADQAFKNPTGLFRTLRALPATATLSLNYKSDALMFNGYTYLQQAGAQAYLSLFAGQQPVENKLKDLLPSTTAYSVCFSVSDIKKFITDLSSFYKDDKEKAALLRQVKAETGLYLNTEFNKLLGNEFAFVHTRFDEKLAIISVKDGSQLRPLMVNISHMVNDDVGQFKYDKIPYYLLGNAFGVLNHPYFMILDNYLILANSTGELSSYKDSYLNHKLLSKTGTYNDFDAMLAERSNVSFFLQFRNTFPILKRDMKPAFTSTFNPDNDNGHKYYALSYQLSGSGDNFYTNFYLRLNKADTTIVN